MKKAGNAPGLFFGHVGHPWPTAMEMNVFFAEQSKIACSRLTLKSAALKLNGEVNEIETLYCDGRNSV